MVSHVPKDSFNARCSIHFNHTAMGHHSHLQSCEDDRAMILVGKSHGSTSTTERSAVLWDYLPLMWIRGYGALGCGDMKAYFLAES